MESEPNAKPIIRTQIEQPSKCASLERQLRETSAQLEIAIMAQRGAQAALRTAEAALRRVNAPVASDEYNNDDDWDSDYE